MHFIEIGDTKYGSDELSNIVATGLIGIGVDSFQSIKVDAKNNSIKIGFDDIDDANVCHTIAGAFHRSKGKSFTCQDARQFMLELYGVATSWGDDQ